MPVPRPVSFAYVAQPGGRLWCVGLADGEVESMHRPRVEVDSASANAEAGAVMAGGRGAAAGGCLELGQLRTVDLAGSWVRGLTAFVFCCLVGCFGAWSLMCLCCSLFTTVSCTHRYPAQSVCCALVPSGAEPGRFFGQG